MEIVGETLDSLDITIIKNDNKLELDWFQIDLLRQVLKFSTPFLSETRHGNND